MYQSLAAVVVEAAGVVVAELGEVPVGSAWEPSCYPDCPVDLEPWRSKETVAVAAVFVAASE